MNNLSQMEKVKLHFEKIGEEFCDFDYPGCTDQEVEAIIEMAIRNFNVEDVEELTEEEFDCEIDDALNTARRKLLGNKPPQIELAWNRFFKVAAQK